MLQKREGEISLQFSMVKYTRLFVTTYLYNHLRKNDMSIGTEYSILSHPDSAGMNLSLRIKRICLP